MKNHCLCDQGGGSAIVVANVVERSSWEKSGCGCKCRFPAKGGLHHTSGDASLVTKPEIPSLKNHCLGDQGGGSAIVVANVVERSSWEKSGCGRKCRFPAKGGLHHTSGDASLVTKPEIPSWCHVYKSKSVSSKRTRVAAMQYKIMSQVCQKHSTKHRQCVHANRKKFKHHNHLREVKLNKVASSSIQFLSDDFLKNNIVVCDGSCDPNCVLSPPPSTTWHCLRICHGDLWVADTLNPKMGLRRTDPGDGSAIFIRLPRVDSLEIMRESRHLCMAVRSCAKNQRKSLSRGAGNRVFVEANHKYCCIGSQPGRAERGVQSGLYRLKHGCSSTDWDAIHNTLRRGEYAFDRYVDTEVIRHVTAAKERVGFRTMEPSSLSQDAKSARIYNGMGFGINVFLRSHIDQDFTMSIVQAHIDEHDYIVKDKIICYFAFPRIGIAVALRPGDFLIFNPQEPHSISSRCNVEDEVYCISSYLKTAVVGLNDNSNMVV